MKIAVNTRLLLKGKIEGIGWFTLEHFSRMAVNHPEHEFHFLFDRPFSPEFVFAKNVFPHVIGPPARHPILFRIWYDYSVPRILKKIGANIFISPDMMCSLRTAIPQIVVLHDLNFEHHPKDLPGHISRYLRKYSPRFAAKAKAIITVSDFSKMDIVKSYGIDPAKLEVIHNGVGNWFHPVSEDEKTETKKKLTGGCPYFVFVSSLHPRKNLHRLLPAFDLFKVNSRSDMKLVVVGEKFWNYKELDDVYRAMQFRDDVIFVGRLEPQELNDTIGAAWASVYISYYEGFGLPVLESFQCGVPVITSSKTSLPEVAGDAALLVDPFSITDISSALYKIWNDPMLKSDLIAKGHARVKDFSWDKAAAKFWEVILKNMS